ncbi:MAG TPA: TonB-dependent receptor [Blastocatellia bacterium]|nr:TonB-dependent receptor [Blastocatellia bacterium]
MSNEFRRSALIAIILLALHVGAYSQNPTATLSGTVLDPGEAAVPGATVTLLNVTTGTKRITATSHEGAFVIPLIQPGRYSLTVERAGFASAKVDNLTLYVGDQQTIRIKMALATVGETVEVASSAVGRVKESSDVGTVVDREFVENLPLNGRSFQSLIGLTPGVVLTNANESGGGGQFSVNGQRSNANYFTVDGVSANIGVGTGYVAGQGGSGSLPGFSAQGGTNNLVSIEALQEFRVLTSSFAPEFGRTPGGQVQLVTRSGGNEFHGTLFNYLRNDLFDANDFFGNANGLNRPALRQNDFGGVIGGPLYLPRFGEGGRSLFDGRNRAFFFFSYEGLRLRQPQTLVTVTPSLRLRNLVAPSIRTILDAFPLPTGAEFANSETGLPTGIAPLAASYSDPSSLDAASLRIDYHFNDRTRIFGRWNSSPSQTERRGAAPFYYGSLSNIGKSRVETLTATFGLTRTFSSRVSNDLRFNYSRSTADSYFALDNFGGAVVPASQTLLPSFVSGENALFYFDTRDAGVLSFGRYSYNELGQWNFVNNLSAVAGDHTLQFGVDYRRLLPTIARTNDGLGLYSNNFNFTGLSGNGELTDDEARNTPGLVLSSFTSYSNTYNQYPGAILIQNFSAYAQDTWRIGNRATLVYGLRYEINPAPAGRNGAKLAPVRNVDQSGMADPAVLAPPGTPLYETTYNNLAPRIGLSYLLSSKTGRETVLRGGVGLFYDMGTGQTTFAASGYPFVRDNPFNFQSSTFPLPAEVAARPARDAELLVSEGAAPDPHLKLPRVWHFNAAIEQSLSKNQTISATYLGALGRRLLISEYLYATLPGFYSFVTTRNGASSDYHALQLQFQRRLSRGLQALASYTWSHSIDNASSDTYFIGSQASELQFNRGNSDFDLRHVFTAAATWMPTASVPAALGRLGRTILGGIALDGVVTARSAPVVNPIGGYAQAGASYRVARPDLVAGQPLYLRDRNAPGGRRFNPAAFQAPPTDADGNVLREGTLGRGLLRGYDLFQIDLAARREFRLRERIRLQFRLEVFNLFNHPNFANPQANLDSPFFGLPASLFNRGLGAGGATSGLNPLYQVGGPRSMQLSLKLHF